MPKKQISKQNGDVVVAVPPSNQPIGPHTVLAQDASVADGRVKPGDDPVEDEIAALDALFENDPQMQAAAAAEIYDLTPGAKSLLDRAIDSLSTSTGAGIDDPEFRLTIKSRAELLAATGGDLPLAISCIVETLGDDPKSISGAVYTLCYSAMKQAVFFANMDMRRWLDPKGDFDLTAYRHDDVGDDYSRREPSASDEAHGKLFYVDNREDNREPPVGLDSTLEREWGYFAEVYGAGVETTDDIFAAALSDVRTYLQLLCEAFGWNADQPMPYGNIQNKDGSFTAITDAVWALDHQQVQSAERRKVRQVKQATAMGEAAKLAAARLMAAGSKTARK